MDKSTVERIARLARIQVSDAEAETLASELSGILNWVESLSELDTTHVDPITSAIDSPLFQRVDQVTDGGKRDDILANAPETTQGFFVVPKVVE